VVKKKRVPWIEAMLRGQRVLARANADRSLLVDSGRVEIRYRQSDGRPYHASARNLEVAEGAKLLDDDACVAAAPATVTGPSARGGSARAAGASASARPARPDSVSPDAWIAYTDGACSGNPGPAGSGVVLVAPNGKMHEGLEYLGEATNNVAELTAILRALEWIPGEARGIVVHTDSQYAIGVLQKGWKAKVNQELVGRSRRLVEARGAKLVYVPGHQGVPLNERADELAREAVQTRATRPALP
jgi:ribonuclease HI